MSRGPAGPRGRRGLGLIAAVVVGCVLVVGATLGDDDDEVPAASERDEETTTTRDQTTRSRPSTTSTTATTAPPAAPLLAGQDLRGWLLSGSGAGWVMVDLATGQRVEQTLPFDDPYSTRAVAGGVVMLVRGEARYYDLREPEGRSDPVSLHRANQILWPLGEDQVWLIDGAQALLTDLVGRVHRSFSVPAEPFDPRQMSPSSSTRDGVLFGRAGRVYLANEAGVRSVAVGNLVGATESSMLVFGCDDRGATCGIELRTPSGALIRRLDLPPFSPDMGWGVGSASDGRFALLTHPASMSPEESTVTLHEPDGTTIAALPTTRYMGFAPSWLPGDAGLVGARGGQMVWVHETTDGWAIDTIEGATTWQSEGVIPILLG